MTILEFLLQEDLLCTFLCNADDLYETLKDLIVNDGISIGSEFIWENTPEGHGFWRDISAKYGETCNGD